MMINARVINYLIIIIFYYKEFGIINIILESFIYLYKKSDLSLLFIFNFSS